MAITGSGLGTTWSTAAEGFLATLITDDYSKRLNDARNNSVPILGLIPTNSEKVSGKYRVEPVMFGRNPNSFSYGREKARLPDPGTWQSRLYGYRYRTSFTRLLFDGAILRASNKDDVAFIDAIERDFSMLEGDHAVDQGRILYGDGSGRLAEVQGIVAGNQITIRLNQSWESVATCTSSPAQHLQIGMRLAFMSNAGVHRGTRNIVSIDSETLGPPSSAVITYDGAAVGSLGAGDWIVKVGPSDGVDGAAVTTQSSINTAYRSEPMGLMGILSDDGVLDGNGPMTLSAGALSYTGTDDYTSTSSTTFQGAPVSAAYDWNRAIIMTGGGALRPCTEAQLQLAASKIEKTNNGKIDMMVSNYGVRDSYGIGLLGQKQYHNTTELRGGWSVLDWNGKPWYVDRLCPENRVLLLGLEGGGFMQYVNEPYQPLNPFGPHWMRLQDSDDYQVPFVMSGTIGVGIRQRCGGQLTDLISAVA